MFLNIITPCSRPENLIKISESINIPKENYRWIVVFDFDEIPRDYIIPDNCEIYLHKNPNSIAGHSQRNFAIDLVDKGHIYMNDDDTIIHPNLWDNIKDLDYYNFISFIQVDKNHNLRLLGNNIGIGSIDSHNFIVSKKSIEEIKWIVEKYDADGWFASTIYKKLEENFPQTILYIPKVLSVYNLLR
jgi:hypothetical protein